MANAPVVIPFALTQLATGVTLNALLTTAQPVVQVPNGMKLLAAYAVFREATATIVGTTTFNIGSNASATSYASAQTTLQSFLVTTPPVWFPLFATTVGTTKPELLGGDQITVTFTGTLTGNGFIKVDVIGYLTAF